MEKSDLANIFSVIKKGLYEYDVNYFDENSLSVIEKSDDEVMALEKMRNIVGGGYLDTLNEYCDMYVEMKGGLRFIDQNLAKWKRKKNLTVSSIKNVGTMTKKGIKNIGTSNITKIGSDFDAKARGALIKNYNQKLKDESIFQLVPAIKKLESFNKIVTTIQQKCEGKLQCKEINKITELQTTLNTSITSLRNAETDIKTGIIKI